MSDEDEYYDEAVGLSKGEGDPDFSNPPYTSKDNET